MGLKSSMHVLQVGFLGFLVGFAMAVVMASLLTTAVRARVYVRIACHVLSRMWCLLVALCTHML
jgi:hypothetical protein